VALEYSGVMVNEAQKSKPGGRGRLVVIELVLLAATLWILIWHPLGQAISLAVSIMLAMVFIGLFPAMLKGGGVAQAERDQLERRFSDKDDNQYR
jgi:phosphate/sulfate permease